MKSDNKDVGMLEDYMFVLQNQVALEHHASLSWANDKKEKWKRILELVRKNRSKWLNRFTDDNNAQSYCMSKHCLSIAMGMKEISNRFLEDGKKDLAKESATDSQFYESLFILINDFDLKGGEK